MLAETATHGALSQRSPTGPAMTVRDGGCQFPGCDHQIVDGHHVHHWADGGETKLDNLVSVCRTHHGEAHDGRISIAVRVDGKPEFRNANGE